MKRCMFAVMMICVSASAADWPRFRGQTGQGMSDEKNVPLKWSRAEDGKDENIAWAADIPGVGHSSPIIVGDRVILTYTDAAGADCHVIAFDRTNGKVLWDSPVFKQEPKRKENRNSYATPTPVSDGQHVFVFFGSGGAAALALDGKVKWTNQEHKFYSRHGLGPSPILFEDIVIMPFDGSIEQFDNPQDERIGWQKPWDKSFILALDKATGKTKYKASRGLSRIAHVTPQITQVGEQPVLVSAAGDVIQGHNPRDGTLLWTVASKGEAVVPSVVIGDGKVFTSSGYEATTIRAVRLDPAARGDITATHLVWEQKKNAPTLPSFIYDDGLLFAVKENGIASCMDAKTGDIIWQERLGGTFAASPVWAEDRLYCLADDGKTTVLAAGREFKVLAENPLNEPCQASPAISDGQILIRTAKRLYCIGARERAPQADAATWYRSYVRVPANMVTPAQKDLWRDSMTLSFQGVASPFSVYLNGTKIIESDGVPNDARRRFKVPKDILQKGVFNVLAVRVAAKDAPDQFAHPPIFAGYFDELVLNAWDVQRGPLDAAAHKPIAQPPSRAAYTESGFRPSSTPLNPNGELMPGQRLPPAESLAKMRPAADLAVDLLLHEPLVAQPTHLSFDERGRLWVAQYRQYPYPAGLKMLSRDKYYRSRFDRIPPAPPHHDEGNDIISVHEDTDCDGKYDKHKVVLRGLNMANAAVRGWGGIWVMHTPYLLFYPDKDGDDVPDGNPEVRLAGFGLEDTHSVANGLAWGPDGWLYGAQGSTTTSRVTRPGVDPPGSPGVYYEASMVWRYHPRTKQYEIFAEGGGNNFGLEFDAEGRLFSGHNGGETRGWYFVQSGRYMKQAVDPGKFGPPANPYSFGALPMMKSRNPIPRFTHALVIAEGTALPNAYGGRIFGADPLHRLLIVSERYPAGSNFETSDNAPALNGDDIAFRPVFLANAPDGSIYVADFYEEYIAHGQNYQGQIDPTTGRVYRLRGKDAKLNRDVDLSKKSTAELIEVLSHPNRWHRQTAVRVLGERRDPTAVQPLQRMLAKEDAHPALESLWALHQMDALAEPTLLAALAHPAAPVRAWAVRMAGDGGRPSEPVLAKLREMASEDADSMLRAQIASTTRRLPARQALPLLATMLRRDADAADPFVPMLCWWTIESRCGGPDREAVLALFDDPELWKTETVRQHLASRLMQRFAAGGTRADFLACARLFKVAPPQQQGQLLAGFETAFKGRALPPLPRELADALLKSGKASPVLRMRLGDREGTDLATSIATDAGASVEDRLAVITALGEIQVPLGPAILIGTVFDDQDPPQLRKAALASLLLYNDKGLNKSLAKDVAAAYGKFPPEVRPAALNLLASRPAWSVHVLDLLEAKAVASADVPPDVAERLRGSTDTVIATRARKLLAQADPSSAEAKRAEIDRVRRIIALEPGDAYRGEAIFMQRCAACHTLFHKGGRIGPDLTPYQRDDLGTMLTSILDPSIEIREGFRSYTAATKDGRTLSGFLVDNDPAVIALRGFDGQDVRLQRADLLSLDPQPMSLMPEGLLVGLKDAELRDLFAYLRIPQPITR